MRRRRPAPRTILPDAKYGDIVLTKFINQIMLAGNKSAAEKVVYGAFEQLEAKLKKNPLELFHAALNNVKPEQEVRSRRVGGATYQVPMPVRPARAQALAIRWIVGAARKGGARTMRERLFYELSEASQNRGNAVKKREDTHKMAEANRAFAHFRW
ncbi:MAG: 30S ribosomal protein S7 [Pseudomonadaceae bacterium]|nr:30S ribosomal protein S7 [Pseudomonadaceae bacterium]